MSSRALMTNVHLAAALALAGAPVLAERAEPLPAALEGVGITERLGEQVPLDVPFTDENGNAVKLGNYFHAGRPVVLDLGYYRCPMLCNLVLNGFIEGLKGTPWVPGRDFELVMISIDPLETAKLAKLKQQNYIRDYGKPESAPGWHFLTGDEESIRRVTEAVGFRYEYVDARREYAHAAVITFLSPSGKVARYLYGVQYEPRDVRLALSEAAEGKTVSTVDQLLLYCFHYDASERRYSIAAMNVMRIGGILVAGTLAFVIIGLWLRESRRKKALPAEMHS